MSDLNIGVLGAGVIGLTTAYELKNKFRNANIDVISDRFNDKTTSHVAAGLFRPGTSFSGPTVEITRQWINDSYHYWDNIWNTPEASTAGVTQVSGYIFTSQYPHMVKNEYIEKLLPIYRRATEEELKLCPGTWKYGCFFTTVLTQCSYYLPWITSKLQREGVHIISQKIESFSQIDKKYDIILNCTGLGAKFLCNDNKLVPMRGQVLKVKAPWIKTFFYGDYDTYIIPGIDCVTLGGCRQYDSYNLEVNKYDRLSIKERCESLVPSLRGAELIAERVGLRPHRDVVRVEKEIQVINGRKLKIVHNYGHGGYGVTTAPGTSLYAVQLATELLSGNSKL
ncbi:D-aspartate oxidase [Tribolium madens]|uniref:D-aspartate oxidase n=1 Tax=Tribolium madens TaxID=41895 RepID=UPI001CF740BA|nr:D-aspartate oxidase [Tribolium madens]